jgi:hypothetical protein
VAIIDDCVKRASGKPVDPQMVPALMGLRLQHFQKSNDAAGCRSTAVMWEKLNRADADSLYHAACFRSVTAAVQAKDAAADAARLAKEETDRAMAWLNRAVAAGFEDRAHMAKDADLDMLREREDFEKLMSTLPLPKK